MKNCHVAQKRIFIHNSSSVSISPSNTLVASPVIKTCLVAISHSMVSVPPSMPMIDFLPARPVRKAATAVAQAPVPPRSTGHAAWQTDRPAGKSRTPAD